MKCTIPGTTTDKCHAFNGGSCMNMMTCTIYDEIKAERQRADAKYGEKRNLPVHQWVSLIRTELEEALTGYFKGMEPPHDYRTEMIQVASLVVAAIESYDRQRE